MTNQQQMNLRFDQRTVKYRVFETPGVDRDPDTGARVVTSRYIIAKVGAHGHPIPAENCDYRTRAFAEKRCEALNDGKVQII